MNEQTSRSFQEIRDDWMKDPAFRKEYRAYSARMDLAERLTKWMRRIPAVGQLVYVFWFLVLTEGYRTTLDPFSSGISFSFLNDGMKPTLWHTWRSVTHSHIDDAFTAIYPGGAPKSLAQAQEWEEAFELKRAAEGNTSPYGWEDATRTNPAIGPKLTFTKDGTPEGRWEYVDDPRPTNPAYDMECGD